MKKIIITVLILSATVTLVLLMGTVSSKGTEKSRSEETLFRARKDNLLITVKENGYLKAKNSEKIIPKFKREGVIMSLVEEGKQVTEGDVLVEFDKTDLQNQIDELENKLIQYETEHEAAVAGLEIQKKDNTAQIQKAELAFDLAKKTLQKYVEGDAPNARRKANLEVERSESEHQRAKDKYDQVPSLLAEGFLTIEQKEEERIRLREAEIKLENARTELELLEKFTRPMEMAQKESDVRDKEREARRTEENAKINVKEKEARVTQATRQVQSTKNRLKKLKEEFDHMTIKAPKDGVVMYGDPKQPWNNDNIKVGGRVWNGMTLLTIPDLSEMQCLVEIHEADINKVLDGQHVDITVDTHKGQQFTGTVTKVAKVASSSNWWSRAGSNKQFPVEVTMEMNDVELRAGITGKVEIRIEELEDVLVIPIHSVHNEEGDVFCFIQNGEDVERKNLELGKNNEHYVEVKEGLQEGDRVLLFDPRKEGVAENKSTSGKAKEKNGDSGTGMSTPGIP